MDTLAEPLSSSEIIALAADDQEVYSTTFFRRTVRTKIPHFHREAWDAMESGNRYVALEIFRDGAKTSLLRIFASKRIAYGISRTIMVVGKGQDHAIKTIRWLKRNIENNRIWTETYKLSQGSKWTDEWIEIKHGLFEDEDGGPLTINVIAYGMTGQVRGVNIDDFRPDLILVDDPCDEFNTATDDARKTISDLFFGAIKNCLVPRSENPNALMALLQTGLQAQDLINTCKRDPEWYSIVCSVFTENGESAWPERWTTEELLKEKEGYIRRNQLSLWLREKECLITSPELSSFKYDWLSWYDIEPEGGTVVIAIDPVPPPTEQQLVKNLHNKDYEALVAVKKKNKRKYILETQSNRGHDPSWTVNTLFTMALRWKPMRIVVETTAYQATLKWLLEQEMKKRRLYYIIEGFDDKARKFHLISTAFSGVAEQRDLYVRPAMHEFVEQFTNFPNTAHDDVLNAVAIACKKLESMGSIDDESELQEEEDDVEPLGQWRHAP